MEAVLRRQQAPAVTHGHCWSALACCAMSGIDDYGSGVVAESEVVWLGEA